jgi:hypothetical protein
VSLPLYVPPLPELRARLSTAAVLRYFGVPTDHEGRGLCPYHDDRENPNLVPLPPTEEFRFHGFFCNACGARGDSLDLVRKLMDAPLRSAIGKGAEILYSDPEADDPDLRRRESASPSPAWEDRVRECSERAADHPELLAYAADLEDVPPSLLLAWGWGLTEGADVTIPHRDALGNLTAVKVRSRDPSRKWRCHGGLGHPYGSWKLIQPARGGDLLLCEGESDTVVSHAQANEQFGVLGLPSGAGTPVRTDWLGGYDRVLLGFDGDDEGDLAASRWRSAAPIPSLRLPVPPGHDLRSALAGGTGIRDLIGSAT